MLKRAQMSECDETEPSGGRFSSRFVGLAIMRSFGRLEPLVSASIDELVAAARPTAQKHLTEEIGANGSASHTPQGRPWKWGIPMRFVKRLRATDRRGPRP